MKTLFKLFLVFFLTACTETTYYAPVSDAGTIEPIPKTGTYRVLPGETLYSIAWRFGLDYQTLAQNNDLTQYHVHTGQLLYLRPHTLSHTKPRSLLKPTTTTHPVVHAPPKTTRTPKNPPPREREPNTPITTWQWPASGDVLRSFSSINKGINISGALGDPVYASAAGKVVYSGHGLRGYGNLIIIKHNDTFLTAYAHNSKVLVQDGDWVTSGQKIAEIGNTGTNRTMLHFEIRRSGKPVNPLDYLSKTKHAKVKQKFIAYFSPLQSWLGLRYTI